MKKSFFTLVLTIVSSAWMTNEASDRWCMPSVRTLTEPWIEVNGTFQAEGFPCEPDEECPPCLTIVLVTSDKTYYLVTDDGQLIDQLDTIPLGTKATVSGIPFEHGSYDYIQVSHIETDLKLPSLCDEWNVWHESFQSFGYINFDQVIKYQLTTDTLINGQQYVKLASDKDSPYLGAMREGNNQDIYYFPADRTQEYLLYAFNAQVGDTLSNLWIGSTYSEEAAYQGVVQAISNDYPRIFTIQVKDIHQTHEDTTTYPIYWIEGVGSPETPYGLVAVASIADVGVYTLLCAYKNGEQIYTSRMGEQYGCEHDQHLLCDEWNVLGISDAMGPEYESFRTLHYRLTKDTIIAYPKYYDLQRYTKLEQDGKYKGAMREDWYGKIYYIPAGSTHEYLLYNFNAKVGDRLTNLWYGGDPERCPNGYKATVLSISDETPRVFTIEVEYIISDSDGEHIIPWTIYWTEGVGLSDGPAGQFCPGPDCACSCGQLVLCAYKNGEQVYVSDMGEQYGCEYNYDPFAPVDTIPLYAQDDPGSSTVDPVDPNQVVATLQGDQLTIHENTGVDVTYSLNHTAPAQVPSHNRAPLVNTFQNKITIQITESGEYLLKLTNPSWGYTIFGQFYYAPQGIDQITNDPAPITTKVIKDGQLFILRGEKVFTMTGQEVK
ncbi:MAG: hypothetical protein J6T32_04925 [Paludibacteraceae bacterium]|nr:hypothetical protein [Paludibacteraceae bacterium]